MSGPPPDAYVHRGGERPLLGETVDGLFRRTVRRCADRPALVSVPQQVRMTYAELDERVQQVARGLMAMGVDRGERVGIWSSNNVEWVFLQLAAARIGAVLVNLNPACLLRELEQALRLARVQHLCMMPSIRGADHARMVLELGCVAAAGGTGSPDRLPELRRVVMIDPDDPARTDALLPGALTWPGLVEGGATVPDEAVRARAASVDRDDPVDIQFTSGTTGTPKAVVLTHHGVVNNGYFCGRVMRFSDRDRLCVPVPFFHCFGLVVANLACLAHGAAIVIPAPHFDIEAILAAIDSERCTAVHGVPTMFIAMLEARQARGAEKGAGTSLRTGIMAGAPCPPHLVQRVIEELPCPELLIAYGQTESSPVTHITRPGDTLEHRLGTVGTNLDHQEVKIVDPATGRTVPIETRGEVCFRGYHLMRGYFDQPDATRETIDAQGWLHSGDLGEIDAEGYLRITGRLRDMVIRGGENIYPAEIEAAYHELPEVAQVAVFGIPDPVVGEEVGAWIRLAEGARMDVEQLRDAVRDRLAHFKVPRHVWIVDEFPLTASGKVQKYRIREIVESWMRAGAATEAPAGEPA